MSPEDPAIIERQPKQSQGILLARTWRHWEGKTLAFSQCIFNTFKSLKITSMVIPILLYIIQHYKGICFECELF